MICVRKFRKRDRSVGRRRGLLPNVLSRKAVLKMDALAGHQDWQGQGPPRPEWSDEDLIREYQMTGSPQAFEELVRRYERELFNYLCQYLRDPEMAEDAFQATFLQVHRKCHQFDAGRRFRPWLYAVATNQAIDAQRRSRRHRLVSLDQRTFGQLTENETGALVDIVEGAELDPEERLELSERKEDVQQALEHLPPALREVILLVYYQGLKYREAAEILNIPVGTVKSRLHSAIRKLEHHLKLPQSPSHA
jgi:RNA polymerase sigma-70 factor (ECF subfamily)